MKSLRDLSRIKADYPANPAEKWQKLRDEVVSQIPSVEDGIEAKKVKAFIQSQGIIMPATLIFLDAEGLGKLQRIFEIYAYRNKWIRDTHFSGAYFPEIEIAVVNRFRDNRSFNGSAWELWNGGIFAEGFAVHELAHAGVTNNKTNLVGINGLSNQTGFKKFVEGKGEKGAFLEEGFAEFMRGKFVDTQINSLNLRKAVSLNLPNGGGRLPAKYGYMDESGQSCFIKASVAGYALELILGENPQWTAQIVACRQSENPILALKTIFDRKYLGLFQELYNLQETEQDFIQGFKITKAEIARQF